MAHLLEGKGGNFVPLGPQGCLSRFLLVPLFYLVFIRGKPSADSIEDFSGKQCKRLENSDTNYQGAENSRKMEAAWSSDQRNRLAILRS